MLSLLLLVAALAHTGSGLHNVSLTVSLLNTTMEGRESDTLLHQLQMNWLPGMDSNWICLFNVSSLQEVTEDTQPLVCLSPEDFVGAYYNVKISFAGLQYPNGWNKGSGEKPVPGDACLTYWIVAYKHYNLVDADCLKIHPTWMWDHRTELENMPVIGLFFPGTYNAEKYNRGSTPMPKETASHFLLTQDSDVWGELIRGIRYLDIDIRYCPNEDIAETPMAVRCFMNYGLSYKTHLISVLKDVKEFLKTAKYEIIILDFHTYPGEIEGKTILHSDFVSFVYSELGDYILPFNNITYNATMNEVWQTGRNVIVAYNESETTKEFPWLWGPVPQLHRDHQSTEGLKTFLQQCMDDANATTGSTLGIPVTRSETGPPISALNTSDSSNDVADMASRNISNWFHEYWWKHANLVATDAFLGNNVTDVNVKACLDKANNIIFQVEPEED